MCFRSNVLNIFVNAVFRAIVNKRTIANVFSALYYSYSITKSVCEVWHIRLSGRYRTKCKVSDITKTEGESPKETDYYNIVIMLCLSYSDS